MNFADPQPTARTQCTVTHEPTRLPRPAVTPHRGTPSVRSQWLWVLALAGLSACATHRADPPQCKGPYAPINQPSSVASNDSQR